MHYYVPPRFDLFEFDDESLGLSPRPSRRWFGARLSAVHLALGGTALPVPGRPNQFRVRKVTDWAAYDVDVTTSHSLSELPL
jgi:hypothetical protein